MASKPQIKTIVTNRRARFDYEILETYEAGLALKGTEIKSVREGRVNLGDAYARPESGELWLVNCHISQYSAAGSRNSHDPMRPRKLLLHRDQIESITRQVAEKGLTVVPLRVYIKGQRAKVELGVARGRRRYDKRQVIIDRERGREAREAVRR
jgi:SsrA-binding protein